MRTFRPRAASAAGWLSAAGGSVPLWSVGEQRGLLSAASNIADEVGLRRASCLVRPRPPRCTRWGGRPAPTPPSVLWWPWLRSQPWLVAQPSQLPPWAHARHPVPTDRHAPAKNLNNLITQNERRNTTTNNNNNNNNNTNNTNTNDKTKTGPLLRRLGPDDTGALSPPNSPHALRPVSVA
eukprot:SAG11_NODE_4316_length_1952_cov_2.026444_2_plen_180_part_00